jgi:8-oxo-dGTP pyrophosphatase MutT (NUDIX family)
MTAAEEQLEPPERRPGGAQIIPRPPSWTSGELAAPASHPLRVTVDDIEHALTGAVPSRPIAPTFPDARASAVLVALADGEQGAEVLLTRRSRHMRNHKGEISFPGGRMDPGETPAETALREAYEEVGLDPSLVTLFAELDHLSTVVSRSHIVPVVGRLPAVIPLAPATSEVERVLWLPLGELVRPDTYHSERWGRSPTDRLLHFFELDDETVWGATAVMLVDLLTRIAAIAT